MTVPICAKCGKSMSCSKTGRVLAECRADGTVFRLRSVDEYRCPICGATVCLVESPPFAERGMHKDIDQQLRWAEATKNVVCVVYGDGGVS